MRRALAFTLIGITCTLPVAGLLGCGAVNRAPEPSDRALADVFRALHRPIYEIYELGTDRDALHRHLARSFDGEALTREYVEHFTTLAHMTRESTAIRVLRVDYESVRVLERADHRVEIDADWSVGGIVTHRRHRHPRTNRYRAVYHMSHGDRGWRITGVRLRDMSRVRGFSSLAGGDNPWSLERLPKTGGGMMSPSDLLKGGMAEDVEALRRRRAAEAESDPAEGDPAENEPAGNRPDGGTP